MSKEDEAHEHMVAGNKAKNDALNTPGASSYAKETGDHLARAAGHFEAAAKAGHFMGADSAKKAHEAAAKNYKEAADHAKSTGDKEGAAALKDKASDHKAAASGKTQVLVVEHADGRIEKTEHASKSAAKEAAAKHLEANGGKGKLVIAPKGKEDTVKPVPATGGMQPAGSKSDIQKWAESKTGGGGADDYNRDDKGMFASK